MVGKVLLLYRTSRKVGSVYFFLIWAAALRKGETEMKKYYVWEVWTGDGKYLGYFLENEKDHADMFARAYDGKVVKSVRFTEV